MVLKPGPLHMERNFFPGILIVRSMFILQNRNLLQKRILFHWRIIVWSLDSMRKRLFKWLTPRAPSTRCTMNWLVHQK